MKRKREQIKWDSVVLEIEKGRNANKARIQFKESMRVTQNKRAP